MDERAEKRAHEGYAKLARHMSNHPENAIFRRFNDLNLLNLLRLQAELHVLEHQLKNVRTEDARSTDPIRREYVNDFRLMRDSIDAGDSLQYGLLLTIGDKLQQYSMYWRLLMSVGVY